MKRTQYNRIVGAVLALAVPFAALADFSSTATMANNTSLSLDTGVSGTNTGDILWTGAAMTFLGAAKGGTLTALGLSGDSGYSSVTLTVLQAVASFASTAPMPASSLTAGTIFAVQTNSGNSAKAEVTAVSGTSISFKYTTFGAASTGGGGGGTATPTITAVLNNSSMIPAGFPNSGISPSSLFVIQGSNLSDSGAPVLQDSTKGLPTSLNGASISISAGGKTIVPAIYYTSPTQIAAELPASTPPGSATITVTYNNVPSAAFSFTVVPSAIGVDTYNGLGVATDGLSGALITYTSSAQPNEALNFWVTGIGADPNDSDTLYTSSPHTIGTAVQAFVGGVQLPSSSVTYVGASVYPGVGVIQIKLPANVATGCFVSVAFVSGSVVSNVVAEPIMPTGGVCNDPLTGNNGTTISGVSGQTTVRYGDVFIIQETMPATSGSGTTTQSIALGTFSKITSTAFTSSSSSLSLGSCNLSQVDTSTSVPTVVGLDAGTLTMTGPSGTVTLTESITGTYLSLLSGTAIPANGGTFVFNASGGADVKAFTVTVNYPNPLSWTNQASAATISRSGGLQVTWTGGGANSYVVISGSSSSTATGVTGSYSCIAPVSAGQFTVPSFVLLGLPNGTGTTSVENTSSITSFTALGLDYGTALGATAVQVKSAFNN